MMMYCDTLCFKKVWQLNNNKRTHSMGCVWGKANIQLFKALVRPGDQPACGDLPVAWISSSHFDGLKTQDQLLTEDGRIKHPIGRIILV